MSATLKFGNREPIDKTIDYETIHIKLNQLSQEPQTNYMYTRRYETSSHYSLWYLWHTDNIFARRAWKYVNHRQDAIRTAQRYALNPKNQIRKQDNYEGFERDRKAVVKVLGLKQQHIDINALSLIFADMNIGNPAHQLDEDGWIAHRPLTTSREKAELEELYRIKGLPPIYYNDWQPQALSTYKRVLLQEVDSHDGRLELIRQWQQYYDLGLTDRQVLILSHLNSNPSNRDAELMRWAARVQEQWVMTSEKRSIETVRAQLADWV